MNMSYKSLIESKIALAAESGMKIADSDINPMLFPHQRDIVKWAAMGGRRAILASFGLGKTFMQLEICRIVHERKGGKTLVICPLGVKVEFQEDGKKLGIDIRYVRTDEEVENCPSPFMVTNYERVRDGNITAANFTCVFLMRQASCAGMAQRHTKSF